MNEKEASKLRFTNIKVINLVCLRCGYKWAPRKARILACPGCKSRLWDIPKGM